MQPTAYIRTVGTSDEPKKIQQWWTTGLLGVVNVDGGEWRDLPHAGHEDVAASVAPTPEP